VKRLVLWSAVILLTVFVPPAKAAMPPVKPTEAVPCYDDDRPIGKGSAKVWVLHNQLAATNPCTYWVTFSWNFDPANPAREDVLFLAPGKKFNWDKAHAPHGFSFPSADEWSGAGLLKGKYVCRYPFFTYGFAKRVYAYNDVRPVPKCVSKNGGWAAP